MTNMPYLIIITILHGMDTLNRGHAYAEYTLLAGIITKNHKYINYQLSTTSGN